MDTPAAELSNDRWQPDLAVPRVAVYGLENFFIMRGDGAETSDLGRLHEYSDMIANAIDVASQPISFPASHTTTRTENRSEVYTMDYVPRFFDTLQNNLAVSHLEQIYRNWLPYIIRNELNIEVVPMESGRSAEAFITDAGKGHSLDVHSDERYTVAYYPRQGQALLVPHCKNARSATDMIEQPATMAFPGAGSFVVFDGTLYPHKGVSTGIIEGDSDEMCIAKAAAIHEKYTIYDVVSNLFEEQRAQIGKRYYKVIDPRRLAAPANEPRRVVSINFARVGTDESGATSLDSVFEQVTKG